MPATVSVQVSSTACALAFQPGAPDNTMVLGTAFLRAYFTAYTYNATSRSSYVSFAPAAPGNRTAARELRDPCSKPLYPLAPAIPVSCPQLCQSAAPAHCVCNGTWALCQCDTSGTDQAEPPDAPHAIAVGVCYCLEGMHCCTRVRRDMV